jgi:hypothetical protein
VIIRQWDIEELRSKVSFGERAALKGVKVYSSHSMLYSQASHTSIHSWKCHLFTDLSVDFEPGAIHCSYLQAYRDDRLFFFFYALTIERVKSLVWLDPVNTVNTVVPLGEPSLEKLVEPPEARSKSLPEDTYTTNPVIDSSMLIQQTNLLQRKVSGRRRFHTRKSSH